MGLWTPTYAPPAPLLVNAEHGDIASVRLAPMDILLAHDRRYGLSGRTVREHLSRVRVWPGLMTSSANVPCMSNGACTISDRCYRYRV